MRTLTEEELKEVSGGAPKDGAKAWGWRWQQSGDDADKPGNGGPNNPPPAEPT